MKITRLLIAACAAVALASFHPSTLFAHEGHDHGAKTEAAAAGSAEAILKEIRKQHELIAAAVTGKNLKDVHTPSEALATLAKTLPDKVSADKKPRVQGSVNNLTKVSDTLHHAADAGDQAKSEAELKKMEGVLQALEQQLK